VFSARQSTFCRVPNVTEYDTRQSFLCRVPDKRHSAKKPTLGKVSDSGSALGLVHFVLNRYFGTVPPRMFVLFVLKLISWNSSKS
jgi:hypothetical protein